MVMQSSAHFSGTVATAYHAWIEGCFIPPGAPMRMEKENPPAHSVGDLNNCPPDAVPG